MYHSVYFTRSPPHCALSLGEDFELQLRSYKMVLGALLEDACRDGRLSEDMFRIVEFKRGKVDEFAKDRNMRSILVNFFFAMVIASNNWLDARADF